MKLLCRNAFGLSAILLSTVSTGVAVNTVCPKNLTNEGLNDLKTNGYTSIVNGGSITSAKLISGKENIPSVVWSGSRQKELAQNLEFINSTTETTTTSTTEGTSFDPIILPVEKTSEICTYKYDNKTIKIKIPLVSQQIYDNKIKTCPDQTLLTAPVLNILNVGNPVEFMVAIHTLRPTTMKIRFKMTPETLPDDIKKLEKIQPTIKNWVLNENRICVYPYKGSFGSKKSIELTPMY